MWITDHGKIRNSLKIGPNVFLEWENINETVIFEGKHSTTTSHCKINLDFKNASNQDEAL